MHILLLVAEYPPITYAGLANYSFNIARHLKKRNNVEVSVLLSRYTTRRYISNVGYVLCQVRRISQLMKKGKADIVYAITFRPEFLLIGLYAKVMGIPLVAHGVGLDVYSSNPLFVQARKITYSIAEQLVCGASFQKEMILREGAPDRKVNVILGGADTEVFRPMRDEREQCRQHFNVEDKFVLLSLGRLAKRKGLSDALKALTYLRDIDDTVLLIAGEGPEKPSLEKMVRDLSLEGKVRFLGFLPTSVLPGVYNLADLFVAPFREIGRDMEGTPLVIQEAMACGIPVISTNSAGIPDLIENGKSGFTVNMNSPKEIAEKIRLLYESPELRSQMALEARKRAQQKLDWKVTIAKTEKVLRIALAQ